MNLDATEKNIIINLDKTVVDPFFFFVNGIPTFIGYLKPKSATEKNSSSTIYPTAGGMKKSKVSDLSRG